jgi:hypothetical protein
MYVSTHTFIHTDCHPQVRGKEGRDGGGGGGHALDGGGGRVAGGGLVSELPHAGDVMLLGGDPLQVGDCFSDPPRCSLPDGLLFVSGDGSERTRVVRIRP